ncbi:MAG: serine/threonine protein kinase [Mariniblastus sp.]|jgi:serine/threonine protein kinase
MMNENPKPSGDEASFVAWELVADCLERLALCWDTFLDLCPDNSGKAEGLNQDSSIVEPDLASFVPDLSPELQHLALVELAKLDMDYRWRAVTMSPGDFAVSPGSASSVAQLRVEDYLERFPKLLANGIPPADLIYEEFHVRKGSSDSISVDKMMERFPGQSEALARLLALERSDHSMSLYKSKRSTKFSVGDQVDDFDLLTELGSGAFATVYLARQRSLQRLVALKISADQGDEAQTLAQLDHPHIVRVYDQRVPENSGCRLLYMNYVAGGTLRHAIEFVDSIDRQQLDGASLVRAVDISLDEQGQSAPVESANRKFLLQSSWEDTVCRIGLQLAGALQYAHEQGVLHRDLKPANILLSAECSPKLVDFNISFCSKLDGANPSAYFGGSLAYMSPEQMAAIDPDNQTLPESLNSSSDLYSLGFVLWELYFGAKPFPTLDLESSWSDTLQALIERRKNGPPTLIDLGGLTGPKARALHETLCQCLEFDPEQRIQSGERLLHELRLCANPEAKAILRPKRTFWIRFIQAQPMVTMIVLVIVPNILASIFNIYFTGQFAIPAISSGEVNPEIVLAKFSAIHKLVNVIAYLGGFYLIVWRSLPLIRATKSPERSVDDEYSTGEIDRMRRESLLLGPFLATAGIAFWTIAGFAFPIALQFWQVPTWPEGYMHFVSAHVLSGMIAGAYPFLAISWFALWGVYPRLSSQPGVDLHRDQAALMDLSRRSWFWMGCAILLPMLAVLLMSINSQSYQLPLMILGAGSFLGSIMFAYGTRRLQNTISTLVEFNKGR